MSQSPHVDNRDAILALLTHVGANGKQITAYDIEQAKRALSGQATHLRPYETGRFWTGEFSQLAFGPLRVALTKPVRGGSVVHELVGFGDMFEVDSMKGYPKIRYQSQQNCPEALAIVWQEANPARKVARWHIRWGKAVVQLPWSKDLTGNEPILFEHDGLFAACNDFVEGCDGVSVFRIDGLLAERVQFIEPIPGAAKAVLNRVIDGAPVVTHAKREHERWYCGTLQWGNWHSEFDFNSEYKRYLFERRGEPAFITWKEEAAHLVSPSDNRVLEKKADATWCYLLGETIIFHDRSRHVLHVYEDTGYRNHPAPHFLHGLSSIFKIGDEIVVSGSGLHCEPVAAMIDRDKITDLKGAHSPFSCHSSMVGVMVDKKQMILTSSIRRLPELIENQKAWLPTHDIEPRDMRYGVDSDGHAYLTAAKHVGAGNTAFFRWPIYK